MAAKGTDRPQTAIPSGVHAREPKKFQRPRPLNRAGGRHCRQADREDRRLLPALAIPRSRALWEGKERLQHGGKRLAPQVVAAETAALRNVNGAVKAGDNAVDLRHVGCDMKYAEGMAEMVAELLNLGAQRGPDSGRTLLIPENEQVAALLT